MRKHIWPEESQDEDKVAEEAERRADSKVSELKEQLERDFSGMLTRQRLTDANLEALRESMAKLLDRAVAGSRRVEVEAREETVRAHIRRALRSIGRRKSTVRGEDLVEVLRGGPIPMTAIFQEIEKMKAEGEITLSDSELGPTTEIKFLR